MRLSTKSPPLLHQDEYTSKTFPPGTTWTPLTPEERSLLNTPISQNAIFNDPLVFAEKIHGKLGRITYPDANVRAAAWARKKAASSWKKMEKHYDEGKRTEWIKTFSGTMKLRHFDPLQRFEEDWDAALNDPALAQYFELHFDKNAPNNVIEDARRGCSSGSKYCHEASLAYVPGPLTETTIRTFEAQLEADITKPNAILMRAMVGNQQSLFDIITNDKRDKTYDLFKGLIGELEKQTPSISAIKLSWLSSATMGFTTGILGVFGGVVAHGIAKRLELNLFNKIDPAQLAKLQHAQSMGLIHRTCEEALAAAMSGKAPKVPVLLMATIDADTLGQIMRGRGAMMNAKNRRKLGSRNVQIGILTDSEALAKFKDNAAKSTGNGVHDLAVNADSIVLNEQAIALKAEAVKKITASSALGAGTTLTLPAHQFLELYEKQRKQIAQAPSLIKKWGMELSKQAASNSSVQTMCRMVMSTEARLAVGSMVVQGIGLADGLSKFNAAKNENDRMTAALSVADGSAGVLGGAAELAAAWRETHLAVTAGSSAAESSAVVAAFRGVGNFFGFAGNVINAWVCFRDANRLEGEHRRSDAQVMSVAGATFMLGGIPLALSTADLMLQAAVKRGLIAAEGLVVKQIGGLVARKIVTRAVTLTVPGLGLLLTLVAVGEVIYVVWSTPTALETWMQGCYFAKANSEQPRRTSWAAEEKALKAIMKEAENELQKQK